MLTAPISIVPGSIRPDSIMPGSTAAPPPRPASPPTTESCASRLQRLRSLAAAHPGGYADLSTASPVDPPAPAVLAALTAAAPAPGYPATTGTEPMREAVVTWLRQARGVHGLGPEHVLPTIGSKEFLGLLPLLLGVRPGEAVVVPELAYPAYADGAVAVGARALPLDDPADWPRGTRLIWLNSPRNPDGRVLDHARLRAAVDRARALGAVIVNDECYGVLGADPGADDTTAPVPSILHPEANGGRLDGILVSASVSKQSNLAGYRLGYAAGDPALVAQLIAQRRRLGLIVPRPMQDLLAAALADREHVAHQRARYHRRLARLRSAVESAGFRVDGGTAGMYLWATRGEDGWVSAEALAESGVLAMPGSLFGRSGARHVRFAVSVSDDRLATAVERIERLAGR